MSGDNLLKRTPPHSVEAEKAAIGAMLISDNAVNTILEILSPVDFYDEKNRVIFESIRELRDNSAPVDVVTVSERLEANGKLEKIGGPAYISEIAENVPSASSGEYYANTVVEKSVLRQLIQASLKIVDNVFEFQSDVERLSDEAERAIFEVTSKRFRGKHRLIGDVVTEALSGIDKLASSDHIYTGLPTGFSDFDDLTSGLQPSSLVVLAARPSMGKTALAINMAQNIANDGAGVLVFSLEMSDQELVYRMLSSQSGIPLKKIRSGRLSKPPAKDWDNLVKAAAELSKCNIIIDDTPAISISEIRSKSRRIFSRYKIGLVIIDHLQLVTAGDPTRPSFNRNQEISFISRSLKALAKELDIPVLVLSQLSRGVESRTDKKPILSDLRESGAIEQDADIVAFLYREEYYKRDDTAVPNFAELDIAKHRNGSCGSVPLQFNHELVTFRNFVDKKRLPSYSEDYRSYDGDAEF
jgi:replicative DNA helicase